MLEHKLTKDYIAVKYSNCDAKYFHQFHLAAAYVDGEEDYLRYNEIDKVWENSIGYVSVIEWED